MKTGAVLGAILRVSALVGLGQSPIICNSNKQSQVPGDADAMGPGTALGEPLAQYQIASVQQGQATEDGLGEEA